MKRYFIYIVLLIFIVFSCAKKDRDWNNPLDPDYIGDIPMGAQNLLGKWNVTGAKYDGNNIIGQFTINSIGGTIHYLGIRMRYN